MATEWTAAKNEKRTTAPENEKNFMISLEREELWLNVEFRGEVGWVKVGSAWNRRVETKELFITVRATGENVVLPSTKRFNLYPISTLVGSRYRVTWMPVCATLTATTLPLFNRTNNH